MLTILARYLTSRVAIHLFLVAFVFTAVFVAYSLATYLSRAAEGLLRPEFVLRLVLMKCVIAADVILPVALYAAVALAAARLRRSGESTGLLAGGFGPADAGAALTPLFVLVAVAVGVVSIWLRPITYAHLYDLRARAESAFDLSGIEPERFYADADGERVVFVESLEDRRMKGVFIWSRQERRDYVIHADDLLRLDGRRAEAELEAQGLRVYQLHRGQWILEGEAGSMTTGVDFGRLAPPGYKRKSAATRDLMGSSSPEDVAELQWRLSRPIGALLLGFLALRCAGLVVRFRSTIGGAIIVISAGLLYELGSLAARSFVKDGVVGSWPGLWWVHACVLLLLLLPRPGPGRAGARHRRWSAP